MAGTTGVNNDQARVGGVEPGLKQTQPGGKSPAEELSRAADAALPGSIKNQAEQAVSSDGYDQVASGNGVPIPRKKPVDKVPLPQKKPIHHLKDGDFIHNPRTLTPGQADELQRLRDGGTLSPGTEKDIDQFLEDYRNKQDRLFPNDPEPHPPYYEPKNLPKLG